MESPCTDGPSLKLGSYSKLPFQTSPRFHWPLRPWCFMSYAFLPPHWLGTVDALEMFMVEISCCSILFNFPKPSLTPYLQQDSALPSSRSSSELTSLTTYQKYFYSTACSLRPPTLLERKKCRDRHGDPRMYWHGKQHSIARDSKPVWGEEKQFTETPKTALKDQVWSHFRSLGLGSTHGSRGLSSARPTLKTRYFALTAHIFSGLPVSVSKNAGFQEPVLLIYYIVY